ncbi:amino acid adenylation domain-containing protein [Solwaraspora sp. WMMB335]|uniref:non-ribosomal peptide synthetase n=1 Tax=Solwaraspora sp. WMMB335 TaxID=3404118 RepID=UPI003B960D5F
MTTSLPVTNDVSDLLRDLAAAGVRLAVGGDGRLRVDAPRDALTPALRDRLTVARSDLIRLLTNTVDAAPADLPVITPDPDNLHTPFAPSDLQESFLIGSRPGMEHYVQPHQYMEFDLGDLDPERFADALGRVMRRQHKDLVVLRDDLTLQVVSDPVVPGVPVTDLRGSPEPETVRELDAVRAAMSRREPPLDRWPWLDVRLTRYDPGRTRLHWNNNNLFSDAPGSFRLIRDVLRAYDHPDEALIAPPISYRDCVLELRRLAESRAGQRSREYWTRRLADLPDAPAIPLAAGADPHRRSRLSRREMRFPAALWESLKLQGAGAGLSPTAVLLGAHAEMLSVWSGSRHFLINNMVTHRLALHPQIDEVMGNFAALYPLEVDWRHDESVRDRFVRLHRQVMADLEHTHWSGVKVLQALNRQRQSPGRAVCPFAVGSALFVGPTEPPVFSLLETPQVTFDCEFWELPDGGLWVIWDVIEDMFPPGLLDAMENGYRTALTMLAERSTWDGRQLSLVPRSQVQNRAWLNTAVPAPPAALLHAPLPEHAERSPDDLAVAGPDGRLTYRELDEASAALARRIVATGVGTGDRVAVVTARGIAQPVAVFGVLMAGAAYVPIDPDWPDERLRLLTTGVCAVVTTPDMRERVESLSGRPVLTVGAAGTRPGPALPTVCPEDIAYVIYTSGSTGLPKGAVLDHRGPAATICDINSRFGVGPGDVLLGVSSLSFDLSVYDIFGSVAAGATLMLPPAGPVDPSAWPDLISGHGVTVWNSVPALAQLLVDAAAQAGTELPSLRLVLLSGDWIPVDLPDRIRQIAPAAQIVSLGGATEASIWSIIYPIAEVDPGWTSIPYGRPLAGQRWYVLDDTGRDVPTWVPGHLYIGGVGVARGYLDDPTRTAAAFISHPRTGERLYRTGDLGRYLPDGDIEFLGRADNQLKIQGYRVEPGEIEHALVGGHDVTAAAVVARDTAAGRQLVAFVTVAAGTEPASADIRSALAERLPGYLVPAQVVILDRLPLSANGKVDRARLARLSPSNKVSDNRPVPASDPVQTVLVEVWESILGTQPIGVHDDFFDLGGQSFAALRATALAARRLGRPVPLAALLQERTVARLAARLAGPDGWSPLVDLSSATGTGTPWVLVHPAGGQVLCYTDLAAHLSGRVYAMQAPGPDNGRPTPESVPELADQYIAALLQRHPNGPYRLGGWSSGAVVAAAMADRMRHHGHQVEQLVVIDAPAPRQVRELDDDVLRRWFDADIAALWPGTEVAEPPYESGLNTAFVVFRAVVRACGRYVPPTLAVPVIVIRADSGVVEEFDGHPDTCAPDWGWSQLTDRPVRAVVLPGTHHTLLTGPSAAQLAAEMQAAASADT